MSTATKDQRTINMVHYPLGDKDNPQELQEYLDTIDATAASKIGGSTGSTNNRVLRADGTGGLTLKNSAVTLADNGDMSGVGALSAGSLALTTDLPISEGGTGQSTATAAFNALSPATTRGDIIVRGASNNERLALGASGTVLTSNGTDPVYATGTVAIVNAGAISNQSTLDVSVSSAYDMYEFDLINFVPATDNDALFMRFSQSSSFLSGGSDYFWGLQASGAAVVDEADSEIHISGAGVGNQSNEGVSATIRVFRPGASSFQKTATWVGQGRTGTPGSWSVQGGGALAANTDAIDGVRFLFASGNINTGFYAVRGYKFS